MKQKRKETNNKCCQKKHHHTSMNQCKLVNSSLHNCTHQLPWCSVSDLEEALVPCKKAFQHQSSLSSFVQCSQHHVLLQSLKSCHHQSVNQCHGVCQCHVHVKRMERKEKQKEQTCTLVMMKGQVFSQEHCLVSNHDG